MQYKIYFHKYGNCNAVLFPKFVGFFSPTFSDKILKDAATFSKKNL